MQFLIADTFSDSLNRLSADEQKAVKITALDLQLNPAQPGLKLHRIEQSKDSNFWSVRVGSDVRLIIHKQQDNFLLCYVDHHDKAYHWASRRRMETHPDTGAAQLVEIREIVQEVVRRIVVDPPAPHPLAAVSDSQLLSYGVPPSWLPHLRQTADAEALFELAPKLPAEAQEAILCLAAGQQPTPPAVVSSADPFAHPDAQRRFRVMENQAELAQALEYPWEKWAIFLHPVQRQWVERQFRGAARVSGSAGTGKTIVALHRAVYLARQNPTAQVVLTTFTDTLAAALRHKLSHLLTDDKKPALIERLQVLAFEPLVQRLYSQQFGPPRLASADDIRVRLQELMRQHNSSFPLAFLETEWVEVVDARQLQSWSDYRAVPRLGRKIRLPEAQRQLLWTIFAQLQAQLHQAGLLTWAGLYARLTSQLQQRPHSPYDYVVVDEAQDLSIPQMQFLVALGKNQADSLFFAGDIGQRIFQTPFSWKAQGVDIRGRSRVLTINYRTSHQIRVQADKLLAPSIQDVDGNIEDRSRTQSVFNGPVPEIYCYDDEYAEQQAVAAWVQARLLEGYRPHEIAILVRTGEQTARAGAAVGRTGAAFQQLDQQMLPVADKIIIGTMHYAKGLEFRAVVVMACDEDVLPLATRLATASDSNEREEVLDTERHLLYVACTRARDRLLVTALVPGSELLLDLLG